MSFSSCMRDSAGHSDSAGHPLQLLALCVFLTFSIVAFQSQRWYRACELVSDSESWSDPWMRRWIAEQEANQDVPELSSGSGTPCKASGSRHH